MPPEPDEKTPEEPTQEPEAPAEPEAPDDIRDPNLGEEGFIEFLDEVAPDVDVDAGADADADEEPPDAAAADRAVAAAEKHEAELARELTPDERLAKMEAELAEERRQRAEAEQGYRQQLWQMREARRRGDAQANGEDADPPAAEIIEQEWRDDGTVGVPTSAIEDVARRVLAEGPGPGGKPSSEAEYLQRQYADARKALVDESPAHAAAMAEFEQGYQWLDREVDHFMRSTGWEGSSDDGYFNHVLEEAGIGPRFRELYPGVDNLAEFARAGIAGNTAGLGEYIRKRAGTSSTPRRDPARRSVPDHPSHTRAGAGDKPTGLDSKKARYAQLLAMDELKMTETQWREMEELEEFLDNLDDDERGRRTVGHEVIPPPDE